MSLLRRFRRVGIGPKDDVFLLDMRQPDGDLEFWAFTEADWFRWGDTGEGKPPRRLVQVAETPPPAADADRDTRLAFVSSGAFSTGEYIGSTDEAAARWLEGRSVLGRLSGSFPADED